MEENNIFTIYDRNLYRTGTSVYSTDLPAEQVSATSLVTIDSSQISSGPSSSITTQYVGSLTAGKQSFTNNETGYILGIDNGVPKFYIGNTGNYLNWTGTQLIVSGNITATTGIIGGWTIGATTLSATSLVLDAGNQKIESTNYVSGVYGSGFHIDSNLLEVGNIAARGLIRTAVFQKDVVSTVGGNLAVLDGDVLDADMTALD